MILDKQLPKGRHQTNTRSIGIDLEGAMSIIYDFIYMYYKIINVDDVFNSLIMIGLIEGRFKMLANANYGSLFFSFW